MGTQFELVKYDLDDYMVFYIERENKDQSLMKSNHIGFVVIELKNAKVKCSLCHDEINVVQTWWHNKLPYNYIIGKDKKLNINLCLDCANKQNNYNISLLKNSNEKSIEDEEHDNRQKLLSQYEIENEQIEYYKIYKKQEDLVPA